MDGADFLGVATRKGPVVYLTEQSSPTFREALRRANLLERDDFYVLFWADTRGVQWAAVVQAAVDKCKEVGAELLVVDTLPQFAGIAGDGENSAGAAMEAMRPLHACWNP